MSHPPITDVIEKQDDEGIISVLIAGRLAGAFASEVFAELFIWAIKAAVAGSQNEPPPCLDQLDPERAGL